MLDLIHSFHLWLLSVYEGPGFLCHDHFVTSSILMTKGFLISSWYSVMRSYKLILRWIGWFRVELHTKQKPRSFRTEVEEKRLILLGQPSFLTGNGCSMIKAPAKGKKNYKKEKIQIIESRSGCSAFFLPKNSQHFELCARMSEIQFCRITVYTAKCVLDNLFLAAIFCDEEHLMLENGWNLITVNGG